MSFLLLVFVIVSSFVAAYLYFTKNFNHWNRRKINGPKPKLVVGNFPSIIFRNRHMTYEFDDIYRKYRGRESVVGVFVGRNPQILLTDPQLVKSVLIGNFKNFHDNEPSFWTNKKIDRTFGRNPFILAGQEWKNKRSEIIPAVTVSKLKLVYPIIQERCKKLTKFLDSQRDTPEVRGHGFDVKEVIWRFTLDIIFASVFGVEAGALENVDCELLDIGKEIVQGLNGALPQLAILNLFPLLMHFYRPAFVPRKCEQRYIDIMKESYRLREKNGNDHPDIVSFLIQLQKKKNLTDDELAAHAFMFFFDGFETATAALTQCLLFLSRNKDVQQKLRAEISTELEACESLSYEKQSELPYLDQCLNESLRMFPPLLVSGKLCTESCELADFEGKLWKFHKDDIVYIPIYSMHRDPEYYPNPHTFDPDRFSEEFGGSKKYREMGVFIPFGDGPRICIGMKYALAMIKAALVEIVSNWEMSCNKTTIGDSVVQPVTFLCAIDGGVWIDFSPLKKVQ